MRIVFTPLRLESSLERNTRRSRRSPLSARQLHTWPWGVHHTMNHLPAFQTLKQRTALPFVAIHKIAQKQTGVKSPWKNLTPVIVPK